MEGGGVGGGRHLRGNWSVTWIKNGSHGCTSLRLVGEPSARYMSGSYGSSGTNSERERKKAIRLDLL